MHIIKDKQIVNDDWAFIADDKPLQSGDITVSMQRWLSDVQQLKNREGKLGLRLNSGDQIELLQNDFGSFNLIEINFSAFTDGRGFSQAWLIRNRFHYSGELRATGHFIRDQLYYLKRVGFNSYTFENEQNLESAISAFDDFSVHYQPSTC